MKLTVAVYNIKSLSGKCRQALYIGKFILYREAGLVLSAFFFLNKFKGLGGGGGEAGSADWIVSAFLLLSAFFWGGVSFFFFLNGFILFSNSPGEGGGGGGVAFDGGSCALTLTGAAANPKLSGIISRLLSNSFLPWFFFAFVVLLVVCDKVKTPKSAWKLRVQYFINSGVNYYRLVIYISAVYVAITPGSTHVYKKYWPQFGADAFELLRQRRSGI